MWQALAALGSAALGAIGQRNANRENKLAQERFASQGIRMRVEDAKAAGVHPLFALGGNVPSYSPSAQNIFGPEFGQNISRAASHFSPEERALREMQLEAARAAVQKDFAMASAYEAQAAVARQELRQTRPVVVPGALRDEHGAIMRDPTVGYSDPLATDDTWSARYETAPGERKYSMWSPTPPNVPAPPAYLTPGRQPGFSMFTWPNGVGGSVDIMLPSQAMAESMESLEDSALQALIVGANAAHFGKAFTGPLKADVERIAGSWVREFRARGGTAPVSRGRLAP